MTPRSHQNPPNEPVIENRKARHTYSIGETLECGIQLRGTEIKSIREGMQIPRTPQSPRGWIEEGALGSEEEPDQGELRGP